MMPGHVLSPHGPCLSDQGQNMDFAFCFRNKYLPYDAIPWLSRCRKQWPPNSTIDKIKKYGCLLVPTGPRTMPDCYVLWRLSFSAAEKQLVHSFNFTQLLCYCLLKLTLKHIVNTNRHAEGLLCSYFLKTALFWVSEEIDIDTFQLSKLYFCFSLCLDKLKLWVYKCYCPNYFIPEHNMFLGKINLDNNKIIINVLDDIKHQALRDLCCTVTNRNFMFSDTLSESLTILGVCFKVSCDKDTAYQWYDEALQCDGVICSSAAARKSKLLEI
ncbi:cyclic GMP-AMP synthase-like receptor 2 [Mytilus galloprovincialis]|uniref:cyclic GMP-AMP synthase-like receptor 2 n=1 Tax=Mytilus galloprovincialis TaxID=29158 RepID=UPI003F7CC883